MTPQQVQSLVKADKVAGNEFSALVDELIECVLPICAGLSPDDGSCLVVHLPALQINMLSVTLHIKLLKVGTETVEIMVIGQDRNRLGTEKVVVPDTDQPQQYRQVVFKRSGTKVFIHLMEAGQHFAEMFRAYGDHQGQSDG